MLRRLFPSGRMLAPSGSHPGSPVDYSGGPFDRSLQNLYFLIPQVYCVQRKIRFSVNESNTICPYAGRVRTGVPGLLQSAPTPRQLGIAKPLRVSKRTRRYPFSFGPQGCAEPLGGRPHWLQHHGRHYRILPGRIQVRRSGVSGRAIGRNQGHHTITPLNGFL